MTAALPTIPAHRPVASAWAAALAMAIGLVVASNADGVSPRIDRGHPAMNEPGRQSLLASYYEQFDRDGDLDAFTARVEARYAESTLRRLVAADDVRARRAAVLALGQIGGIESNASLAAALGDDDPIVRKGARDALWSVWFRADSPENNDRLRRVSELIGRGLLDEADRRVSALIARAPGFAEAYNQRAIISFAMGRYAESAADCRRVLDLNPYHFGALGGLGQCYLRLDRPDLALETYRRLLQLEPHDKGLRRVIAVLEIDRP